MKPICARCGKAYGARDTHSTMVRWDTPTKELPMTPWQKHYREKVFVLDGSPQPPPPYAGNMRLVKETTPYLSADGRMTMERVTWDGESYRQPYEPFCTLSCSLLFARAAHAAGYRIIKKREP